MQGWQQISEKFIALSMREKLMILSAGVVVITMLMSNLVIEGYSKKIEQQQKTTAQLASTNNEMSVAIAELQNKINNNPNHVLQQQIDQVQNQIAQVDANLLTLASSLIDPIEMRMALQDLLKKQPSVKIVKFKTLPVKQLALASDGVKTDTEPSNTESAVKFEQVALFQHGIELTLNGKYFELAQYLTLLESLQWRFFWHTFEYQRLSYPNAELKLVIYSLSTHKEFVGV